MIQGRSIRLFLVDGTPNGLLSAEIMNWTGHVLTGPRSKLSELVQRPECGRTGVYFLVGSDPKGGARPLLYVGESDDVGNRLKQHNRPEEKGGKDFWEKVCLVTSKDQNLTKAHVKYLESLLIKHSQESGRYKLVNGTAHDYVGLPESDKADMAFFLEQIRTVMPVLGLDFLRERSSSLRTSSDEPGSPSVNTPRFVAEVPKVKAKAYGQEVDGEFYVLAGSYARGEWTGIDGGYRTLYMQLCEEGVLVDTDNGLKQFSTDYAFSSPSAASAIIVGRNSNGRIHWKVESSGHTYAAWQDQQVSAVTTHVEGSMQD